MLTREEARAIARVHLDSMERPDLPLVLVDESTVGARTRSCADPGGPGG